ncbi:phage late control D family protein [Pararhodobacter sp. CCB-MM2]|uniref:phage late control D family protein n=1 Tax=Pararhodobacter sp. CCB-MM2 TaxID=1786003 RepID=UPI000AE45A77|nr:contractile injection system protein, VgrG/Pvc8 family [Pararhodobacter sp. CCB-MM2]
MTHPIVQVSVDGVPASGPFFSRLIDLTITDREGIRSDTLEIVLNDPPPHVQSPRRGARIEVTITTGLSGGFVGAYIVDRVDFAFLPYTVTVKGHSADLTSALKENKSRHWDDKSVRQVVEAIAADHGLETRISDAVSGHVYDWLGQQDESDLHFLERIASRHGALFTIKNGTLLWLERGTGKTADGTSIAPVTIMPQEVILGSGRMAESDVDRFATVKAYWQDREGATRREVVVEADPEASGEHVLRDPFASQAEAEAAARAAVREMLRGSIDISCAIVGRPSLMAGQPIRLAGVRPLIDGRDFIPDLVQHSYSKSAGLRTQFTGKLKADE